MAEDVKTKIVDAMLKLAAERRFEDIAIREIAAEAGVSLAGFSRRIDRAVLATPLGELANSSARDRLFDVLMRRLDAMAPYRSALRGISAWVRRDPSALLAMNQLTVNSMRFMLEAAEIESDGPAGAVKVQGLAFAWARVFAIWLEDAPPDFSKTMAALDRELTQGDRLVAGLQRLDRLAEPLRAVVRAATKRRDRGSRENEPAADSAV
jgi:AcrR family transcriptional regulator